MPKCSNCDHSYEPVTGKSNEPLWGCVQCGQTEPVLEDWLEAWRIRRRMLERGHVNLLSVDDIPFDRENQKEQTHDHANG